MDNEGARGLPVASDMSLCSGTWFAAMPGSEA